MPTKHNKIRYKSTPKNRATLTLTGRSYLQYRDDDKIEAASKGDLLFYPSVEALHTIHHGDYESARYSGYFKTDVHDGKEWKPLLPNGIFNANEHHFSKRDYPADIFAACAAVVASLQGRILERTYREHYKMISEDSD